MPVPQLTPSLVFTSSLLMAIGVYYAIPDTCLDCKRETLRDSGLDMANVSVAVSLQEFLGCKDVFLKTGITRGMRSLQHREESLLRSIAL